jgi:hypothetical protein
LDAVQVAGKVLEVAHQFAFRGEFANGPGDVIGVGARVADFLRYTNQVEGVDVNVATSATVEEYALLPDRCGFRAGGNRGGILRYKVCRCTLK